MNMRHNRANKQSNLGHKTHRGHIRNKTKHTQYLEQKHGKQEHNKQSHNKTLGSSVRARTRNQIESSQIGQFRFGLSPKSLTMSFCRSRNKSTQSHHGGIVNSSLKSHHKAQNHKQEHNAGHREPKAKLLILTLLKQLSRILERDWILSNKH